MASAFANGDVLAEQHHEARVALAVELGWFAFHAGLTALVVWIATVGLAGIPSGVWWFLAGAIAADVVVSWRAVLAAGRDWRQARRLTGEVAA